MNPFRPSTRSARRNGGELDLESGHERRRRLRSEALRLRRKESRRRRSELDEGRFAS